MKIWANKNLKQTKIKGHDICKIYLKVYYIINFLSKCVPKFTVLIWFIWKWKKPTWFWRGERKDTKQFRKLLNSASLPNSTSMVSEFGKKVAEFAKVSSTAVQMQRKYYIPLNICGLVIWSTHLLHGTWIFLRRKANGKILCGCKICCQNLILSQIEYYQKICKFNRCIL